MPRSDRTNGAGRRWLRHGGVVALLVALFVAARLLPVDEWIDRFSAWVDGMGACGPAIYGLVYIIAVLLLVPGSIITLTAGALFGLGWGTAIVSLASTTAAALAFLIARYLARKRVNRMVEASPKFKAIDRAIGERGWIIVGLLRLSPVVPFTLSNYFYGLTAVRFVPYVLASWTCMLPGTFLYVYLGYVGRESLAGAAGGSDRSMGEWILLGSGLLATIIVTVVITRIAVHAIRDVEQLPEGAEETKPNDD